MVLEEEIAHEIKNNIVKEFKKKHLSGNLMKTIQVYHTENDRTWAVEIPAQRYDLRKWSKEGVIEYIGENGLDVTNKNGKTRHIEGGSYAQSVNQYGGFSKTHYDYVEKAIYRAITVVLAKYNIKGEIKIDG